MSVAASFTSFSPCLAILMKVKYSASSIEFSVKKGHLMMINSLSLLLIVFTQIWRSLVFYADENATKIVILKLQDVMK